jgi:hypothetical protein
MSYGAIAIRVRETSEDDLSTAVGSHTKQCRGCDPDVPGHVAQRVCKRCKGTGREPFQFLSVFSELAAPNEEDDDESFY